MQGPKSQRQPTKDWATCPKLELNSMCGKSSESGCGFQFAFTLSYTERAAAVRVGRLGIRIRLPVSSKPSGHANQVFSLLEGTTGLVRCRTEMHGVVVWCAHASATHGSLG